MGLPWGKCLRGAATELGLSHFLKQVGAGRRRKERKHSQVVTGSLIGASFPWSHLMISPITRGGGGGIWLRNPFLCPHVSRLPSQTFPVSHSYHRKTLFPFPIGGVPRRFTPTGPLFFSQLIWSHRVPISSSCFGSDLILWSPLSSLLILIMWFFFF